MFPLFLDLTHRLALVVGGGSVGRRKAAALLKAGAQVRLVCLEARPADENEPNLRWLQEPYRPDHLRDVCLVCAAANAEVNRQVAADARRRGIWVNCADDPKAGDFFMPAVLRRGELTVAVSTQGASPGLAQAIRDWLDAQIDDAFEKLVALLSELRSRVLEQVKSEDKRKNLYRHLCQAQWLERLRREKVEDVREAMVMEIRRAAELDDNRAGPLQ